jgi:transposase
MSQTASQEKHNAGTECLYVAFELGWTKWGLAFCSGVGQKPLLMSISARDTEALEKAMSKARTRLGLSACCPVFSCYEAGRDGFWLHRCLEQKKVSNFVVDSSSIEVNRRARRVKTDGLDAQKLLTMLVRYVSGERGVWRVVHVPTAEEEDARHAQREIKTLKKEQTRVINRVRGLLASQGVEPRMGRKGLLDPLESIKIWDGSPLPEGLKRRVSEEMERFTLVHAQILKMETERNKEIRSGQNEAAKKRRRLTELKAVGPTTAETLMREILFRDFKNRRELGGYSGLTPCPFQSGDLFHESGISRAGNRHIRAILIELAWDWLRLQPHSALSLWYQRRFGSAGPRVRKIGIVALARKLLIALWRYAEQGELPDGAQLKTLAA